MSAGWSKPLSVRGRPGGCGVGASLGGIYLVCLAGLSPTQAQLTQGGGPEGPGGGALRGVPSDGSCLLRTRGVLM